MLIGILFVRLMPASSDLCRLPKVSAAEAKVPQSGYACSPDWLRMQTAGIHPLDDLAGSKIGFQHGILTFNSWADCCHPFFG